MSDKPRSTFLEAANLLPFSRWFIVFFLLSCPLLTSLSGISTPNEQTSSNWTQFLHLTDCELPCWIHIEPGSTTLAEAQAQVETVYADTSLYDVTKGEYYYGEYYDKVIYRPTGYQVRMWIRSDDGEATPNSIVQVIFWELAIVNDSEIKRPTLADFKEFFGDPETVRLSSGVEVPTVTLSYRTGRVYLRVGDLECDKILLNQEVPNIALYGEPPTGVAWLSLPQEWVGYDYCYNFERVLS